MSAIGVRESYEARLRREAAEKRTAFFAEQRPLPDLEFLTPECSICGLPTEYDNDHFTCQECEVSWERNGDGQDAFEWNDEPRAYEGGLLVTQKGVESQP